MKRPYLPLAAIALMCLACPKTPEITQNQKDAPLTAVDPLGPKPALGRPVPFKAPEVEVYRTEHGLTVWLVERPALPLVSLTLAVPVGSADDPAELPGLAHFTANMLDEGAGSRDAIAISTAIEELGGSLGTDAGLDGSRVSLTVLKKGLPQGFAIFADVLARPHMDPKEIERVGKLWQNQLRRRDDSAESVASLVSRAVLYGVESPYGHPTLGQLESAPRVTTADVKKFYARHWRPDRGVLVVAGDVRRAELDGLIAAHLADWKAPAEKPPVRATPSAPHDARPRLVLVDRPDAPQAVIAVVAPGVRVADPDAPLVDLVNTALGGSFSSRLNQNLREDHGWTYGARSSFVETRGLGPFVAQAAVFVDVTAPALRELLLELEKMKKAGLNGDELDKVRARDLTELIETNETIDHLVGRLGSLSLLELAHDHDARASEARQRAKADELAAIARTYFESSRFAVIVVGPRAQLEPQLKTLGLGDAELWSPHGKKL
ncbi:MAG: insulinase family protein [Myxococcales bacterium]|nr:insulinase family protein [Myxococcales bacterium]